MRTAIPIALIAGLCGLSSGGPAPAQTACPVGTTPGSAACGPSPTAQAPAPPPTPAGEWMDRFGAVAADMAPTGDTGVAANRLSRQDAADEALANADPLAARGAGSS